MRRLIGVLVVIAIFAGGLLVLDVVVRHRVERDVARHIEAQVPGSTATVSIPTFPFLGHLAVSGTVPRLSVDVRNVDVAGFSFSSVRIRLRNLRIRRSQLLHRRVSLVGLSSGSVTATLTQASVDRALKLPITLGAGTAGVGGVQVPVSLRVSGDRVSLALPAVGNVGFTVPQLSLLPCVGSAALVPGAVVLSCAVTHLPPALSGLAASF